MRYWQWDYSVFKVNKAYWTLTFSSESSTPLIKLFLLLFLEVIFECCLKIINLKVIIPFSAFKRFINKSIQSQFNHCLTSLTIKIYFWHDITQITNNILIFSLVHCQKSNDILLFNKYHGTSVIVQVFSLF